MNEGNGVCMYVYVCMYVCMYIDMCVCVCVCVCLSCLPVRECIHNFLYMNGCIMCR